MKHRIAVIGLAVGLAGCATTGQSSLAGTWEGIATPSAGPEAPFTMKLTQNAASIGGSITDNTGGSGPFDGTIKDNNVSFKAELANGFVVIGQFVLDGDTWAECSYQLEGVQGSDGKGSASRTE